MNLVADILIALIIIGFTLVGWKKGFIKILPGIVNVAVAIFAAGAFCSVVGALWPLHESTVVAKIIAFILIFIAVLFGMKFLRFALDKICEKTFFKLPNKLLGIIFGLILGVFYAWTFSTLVGTLAPTLAKCFPDVFETDLVEKSYILKIFYNFNPLTLIKIFK